MKWIFGMIHHLAHLLKPLIECLEIDFDQAGEFMVERIWDEEGVDCLSAGGEFGG